jgi:hypothetical protein
MTYFMKTTFFLILKPVCWENYSSYKEFPFLNSSDIKFLFLQMLEKLSIWRIAGYILYVDSWALSWIELHKPPYSPSPAI